MRTLRPAATCMLWCLRRTLLALQKGLYILRITIQSNEDIKGVSIYARMPSVLLAVFNALARHNKVLPLMQMCQLQQPLAVYP